MFRAMTRGIRRGRLFSITQKVPDVSDGRTNDKREDKPSPKNIPRKYWETMPEHTFVFDPITMRMPHPIYQMSDIQDVKINHVKPKTLGDRWAYFLVNVFRLAFDKTTRYSEKDMTEMRWFRRVIFLETIAGVPGFVGGMCRHLRSLRTLNRDGGWINHLLAEAENERQHLLTFMHERNPGYLFRALILAGQGVFMNIYFISYLLAPKTCHRFVGYLEDQAVKTYTHMLRDIDDGEMKEWGSKPCTYEAKQYWQLPEGATWRDVVLAIRADESVHREFNHYLADYHKVKDLRIPHKPLDIKSRFERIYIGDKEHRDHEEK